MARTILVVDDSPTMRQQVRMPLEDAGYKVLEAGDGQEALRRLDGAADVHMVISDVNMPGMNGLEMLEALRKIPRFAALPVVMLTTEGKKSLVERAEKAGARGWLVKPFKAEVLLAAARKLAGSP
jgi:two-component system chemotaxis response regulator CheY